MRKFFFSLFLLITLLCEGMTYPQLTPKDTKAQIDEILQEHVLYQKLTPELIQRILQNFLSELDPSKTYFIESEIQQWTNPSKELCQNFLRDFETSNYKGFTEIYQVMIQAIQRRNHLEQELENVQLPKASIPEDQKEIPWAKTKEELKERLLKIKALQLMVLEKLNTENKDQFLPLLKKRRTLRESEFLTTSLKEKQNIVLTYVLKSLCSSLDTHTNYFTPSEASQFVIQVQQRLFGIGVQLRDHLNGFQVMRVIEKSPASQIGGLKVNDLIIAINHEPIVGLDITDAVEKIRGEQGTSVLLTILRPSKENASDLQKIDVDLKRNEVVLEESRLETAFEPYGDGVIAYLRLFSFYQDPNSSSSQDLKKALDNLKKQYPLKGVVLDLRSNAGGLLPQAVSVSGLFVKKGIVVSIKDNTGQIHHLRNTEEKPTWEGPLVVLTNVASASAAEIVAQTLQDYGRAIIVGDKKTFGKGTFQSFTLDTSKGNYVNPKGEFKVTRGMYYTVSGKSPQLKGVQADIVAPGIFSKLDIGEEFAKYPLPNGSIQPHFVDDFSDIPAIHRTKVKSLYNHDLQERLTLYTQYLDILRTNSKSRIQENKIYQNFIKELGKKDIDSDSLENFGQNDLQLTEGYNVIKDLIFLNEIHEKYAASY